MVTMTNPRIAMAMLTNGRCVDEDDAKKKGFSR